MGAYGAQMKGFLPWLVTWACRADTREFCPALSPTVGPVQNIFSSPHIISPHLSPLPSKLDRQSCCVACLLKCVSGNAVSAPVFYYSFAVAWASFTVQDTLERSRWSGLCASHSKALLFFEELLLDCCVQQEQHAKQHCQSNFSHHAASTIQSSVSHTEPHKDNKGFLLW